MNKLINCQEAIDVMCSVCEVDTPKTCSTIQEGDMWCPAVYYLLNLPPAEPKKGKWIPCTKSGLPLTELGR